MRILIQDENINKLSSKVGYLEAILNALISRKVINHSINKFISKYKDSLVKTFKTKNKKKRRENDNNKLYKCEK